jgi:hypothetical protein
VFIEKRASEDSLALSTKKFGLPASQRASGDSSQVKLATALNEDFGCDHHVQ